MSILSDVEITERALKCDMISPFISNQINKNFSGELAPSKLISYGLSSFGYDVRVVDKYLVYHNAFSTYIDPKAFDERSFLEVSGQGYCFIPPNSFVLTETIEYIKMPRDCVALVAAKSSLARCGLVVNATILEPEWEGTVTLELSNTTPLPIKVYSNEGIVQLIFIQANKPCKTSYADRKGKYQFQNSITLPRV